MNKILAFVLVVLSCCSIANAATITHMELQPPPIEWDLVDRMWEMIKQKTNAPADLPPPKFVLDWKVPKYARMGTQFPTVEEPNWPVQISIAPRTIDLESSLLVLFGMGHEMLHYVFVLRENEWDTHKQVFTMKIRHHCNPEFRILEGEVVELLWSVYHSSDERARMYDEIQRSCANFPQQ